MSAESGSITETVAEDYSMSLQPVAYRCTEETHSHKLTFETDAHDHP